MRRTHRLPQRLIRWTGSMVSLSIVITGTVTPLGASNTKSPIRMAQSQRPFVPQGARQPAPKDKVERVNPTASQPGAPSVALPNREQARQRQSEKPKAPRTIDSTLRSLREPLESRQGRKVGDSLPARKKGSRINLGDGGERVTVADADARGSVGPARSHHARPTRSLPTGKRSTASSAKLLTFIGSMRGLANHCAFDFLRYPTLHSDTQARFISELHKPTLAENEGYSFSENSNIARFNLFVPPMPQSGSSKIVYASNRDGSMQIYVMNADGSAVMRLTYSGANDDFPRWSSDGAKILFQSDRDHLDTGYMNIYLMNADGSGVTRLTTDENDDSMATWSPDGSKIVFQSKRSGTN